jgi:HAD superfamily hydrolase (TIGR01509 family)
MTLKALIFDVDGTLAETEELHRQAFNEAFASLGISWTWSQSLYRKLLRITGGKERILHYLVTWHPQDVASIRSKIPSIYNLKTRYYAAMLQEGTIELRPGVARLFEEVKASGVRLAIATTTNRANVSALLQRALPSFDDLHFDAIVAGDDSAAKKPSPEVFEIALRQLRLHASCCVAFEDSSNGVIAAQRARLKVIATPSAYFSDDDFTGAHSVISHLGEPHHAHRHLAGWSWPGDFVTLAALHAWSEKISA